MEHTWSVGRWSFLGSVLPTLTLAVGLAAIVGGTWGLVKPWGIDNSRAGFAFMLVWGFLVLGMGSLAFIVVVRHVDRLEDGRFRFRSRVRSLTVHPEEMTSIVGLPWYLDFYGCSPFRLSTAHGSIFVDRHMPGGMDLETTLRQAGPRMRIERAWELGPILPGRPTGDISNIGPR